MLACDAKNHVFFDIERCEMLAIQTLAAAWPATQLRAMPNLTEPKMQRRFSVKFPLEELGTQLRISVHGPLRPPSLSIPWPGMIMIMPFGILVQVHRNGYFLQWCSPKPTPPLVFRDSALGQIGQIESPRHPLASQAPPQKAPTAWRISGGIFSVKFWCFPASGFGHPKKSLQRSVAKNPSKNSGQKSAHTIRATKKVRATNPCQKSLQKVRANGFFIVNLQIEKHF